MPGYFVVESGAGAEVLKPFDEAPKDPAFEKFRTELLEIVRKRDLSSFQEHLHPEIKMSLGDGTGIPAATAIMREEPSRWETLERILQQGGKFKTFDGPNGPTTMFFAPYTYFADLDGVDPFHVAVVTGQRVSVRESKSVSAPVIARLSHEVVYAFPRRTGEESWIRIRTPNDQVGYVRNESIAWPTDFRAVFALHEGEWTLRVFLAGD
jgi:hypothetical protein